MYVSNSIMFQLIRDYTTGYPKTILDRIRELPQVLDIRELDMLGNSGNMFMVQMDRDVLDLVRGIDPTMIQWTEPDNLTWHFRIIAMAFPRFRNQIAGKAGILRVVDEG